ncbi:MAG: filamentous hemagglutinin N-terminal domain-containing protein [Methylococcales bacterium]|nr:filamentous hemagglutinin N-terminal domain-containing protein [Methylococcales bacterium]
MNTFKFLVFGFAMSTQFTFAAGIATDGTMGAPQTLTGANVTIPQTLGTTVGNNLFHSFSDFNINTGQTATFTGGDNLQNVISRVTGGNASNINGVLKSDIKNADFYFINPNGITFGANASVDVPAAFHVSTADKMDFGKNGSVFYVDLSKDSKLSSDAPAAFGFLGTSKANNGLIDFNHSSLVTTQTPKNGQMLDVVAGQIQVDGGGVKASILKEEIRLIAMQGDGLTSLEKTTNGILPLPDAIPSTANAGDISINDSKIQTLGDGGQRIGIWGGDVSLKNTWLVSRNDGVTNAPIEKEVEVHTNSLTMLNSSSIWTDNTPSSSGKAGNVSVTTTEAINLSGASTIESDSYGMGDAGSVNINANQIMLNSKAEIVSRSAQEDSKGNGGNIFVKSESINMDDNTSIYSATSSQYNSGNVIVKAGTINMNNDAWIYAMSKGTGKTGDVTVESTGLLNMVNGAEISDGAFGLAGGNVTVKAGKVNMDNKAKITSLYAGDVTVNSTGALNVSNGAGINNFSDTGNMAVTAASINLDGKGVDYLTGIYNKSVKGGNITVSSIGSLDIVNGAMISAAPDTGDSGNITISVGSLKINNQTNSKGYTGIYSSSYGVVGKTGNVTVDAHDAINVLNGGVIFNSSFNASDAGNVTVKAGTLKIDGSNNTNNAFTGIYSEALYSGDGGGVNVESRDDISILHGGVIDTSALLNSTGKAGDIAITAKTLEIDGLRFRLGVSEPSGIYSKAEISSGGKTGNVNITANNEVNLSNLGKISIENGATPADANKIASGTITVDTPNINMTTKSQITSQSTGNIAAGNIAINFANRLNMNSSFITTEANTGDGGSIKVNGGELIYLKNSGFKTTVSGENGNGGDISAKAEMLIMDTGLIQANAKSGNGGNINLALQALIPSADTLIKGGKTVDWNTSPSTRNVIQAASQTGVSGTVTNSAPQLNLSGVLANVGNSNFDNNLISQDYCALGQGSSLTKKGKGGLPLRAKDLR